VKVVGRTSAASTSSTRTDGKAPDVWSPHQSKAETRDGIPQERWFVEGGVTFTRRNDDDVFSRRLEEDGRAALNRPPLGAQLALGFGLPMNLSIVARYDLLPSNRWEGYEWRTHGMSAGLRGTLPLLRRIQLLGELDLGLALAHRTAKPWYAEGVDDPAVTHTRLSEDLAPLVRVAGGVLVGGGTVGAALTVAYVHAAPVSDFDAVHNDGGLSFGVALRVRGLR
jgi:hypothetical protein